MTGRPRPMVPIVVVWILAALGASCHRRAVTPVPAAQRVEQSEEPIGLGSHVELPPKRAVSYILQPGEGMYPSETMWSPNGQWRFTFRENGTFDLAESSGRVVWRTSATGEARNAYMNLLGDFTACDEAGQYFWHSGTNVIGSHLVVEDVGRVAIYTVTGTLVWSTERVYPTRPTVLPPLNSVPDEGGCQSPKVAPSVAR